MPGANACNLAETLVRLAGKPGDALKAVANSNADGVNELILLEDGRDGDLLLEELEAKVDLVLDASTVELDLHNVGPLLPDLDEADLRVRDDADDLAVLGHARELAVDLVLLVGVVLGSVLGEGLLL